MSAKHDDDALAALLRAADPVRGWTADSTLAFRRLQAVHPELSESGAGEGLAPSNDVLSVTMGDLTVEHRTMAERRRMRRGPLLLFAAAAVVVALIAISLIAALASNGPTGSSRLRTLTPAHTPVVQVPSPLPTLMTPALIRPLHEAPPVATSQTSKASSSPSRPAPLAPAGLDVHATVSATTVPFGGSITVTYSWSDGDGQLLDINSVESTAWKLTKPAACTTTHHAPRPSQGRGNYVFTSSYPTSSGVVLTAGLKLPFDHPESIRVGVDIRTGGGCAPIEERLATQWVTLLPPPITASPSPTASATP